MNFTWDDFNFKNKDNKKDKFESLSHYLFLHEYDLLPKEIDIFSNQPGVEIQPKEVLKDGKIVVASYQAKHSDGSINWEKCKTSVKQAIKQKKNAIGTYKNLELIDFYFNKNGSVENKKRNEIETLAMSAGIVIQWRYGNKILTELNNPNIEPKLRNIAECFFDNKLNQLVSINVPKINKLKTEVVGRDLIIPKLKEALEQVGIVQLYGLPGVGKSTLAKQLGLIQTYSLGATIIDARNLFKQNATTTIEEQVYNLSERVISKFQTPIADIDAIEAARHLFKEIDRLLIVDNFDEPAVIKYFVEQVQPKQLIITSRRNSEQDLCGGKSFLVEPLQPEDSLEQFCSDSKVELSENNRESIEEICELLGYLPIAVNLLAVQLLDGQFENNPKLALEAIQHERLEYLTRYGGDSINPEDSLLLCFELFYKRLSSEQKEIFNIFGILTQTGVNIESIAYLYDKAIVQVKYVIDELVRRSLVERNDSDEYFLHTLLREYANRKFNDVGNKELITSQTLSMIKLLVDNYDSETKEHDIELFSYYWKQAACLCYLAQPHIDDVMTLADATYAHLTRTSQYWEALLHGQWMLENVRTWNLKHSEVICLDMIGNIFQNLKQYDISLKYHEDAKSLAEEWDIEDMLGIIQGNLGNTYEFLGDSQKALDLHHSSREIAEKLKDFAGVGAAYGNIAISLRSLGQYFEAYDFAIISLFYARVYSKNKLSELNALMGFISSLETLFDPELCKKPLNQSLHIAREIGSKKHQVNLLRRLAKLEKRNKNYDNASQLLKESSEIAIELDDFEEVVCNLGFVGQIHLAKGELSKAQDVHKYAYELAKEFNLLREQAIQLESIGIIFQERNDSTSAIEHYEKAREIFKTINYCSGLVNINSNIGFVHYYGGDFEEALNCFTQSLVIAGDCYDMKGVGLGFRDIGYVFAAIGAWEDATVNMLIACLILKELSIEDLLQVKSQLKEFREDWNGFDNFMTEILVNPLENPYIKPLQVDLLVNLNETLTSQFVRELIK